MVHREFLNLMGQQKKIKILLFDLQIYLARQISGAVKHTVFVGTCALYVLFFLDGGLGHLHETSCTSLEHCLCGIAWGMF